MTDSSRRVLITDAIVEKAWRAADKETAGEEYPPSLRGIRAALEAVADDIVEECAKTADIQLGIYQDGVRRSLDNPLFDARYSEGKEEGYRDTAKRIRSLRGKP